jgi:N-acetylglucosamine kinase-like BadF-type ATPase
MPRRVLGIDAGGSRSLALLADASGEVLAEARSRRANLQLEGEAEVASVVGSLVAELGGPEGIEAVCLGGAGVDRPQDAERVRRLLRSVGLHRGVVVANDAEIALVAGAPDGLGIVVVAGTGALAWGRDPGGKTARAGGYGFLLSDEGSAYWIGQQALRAAVRAEDRRGPQTSLGPLLYAELEASSIAELLAPLYEARVPRDRIAAIAPAVQRAADGGDRVARQIVEAAGRELALAARAVAGRLSLGAGPWPLVLSGGAFKACPALELAFAAALELPQARPRLLASEPALGAVRLACRKLQA